MKVSVRYFASLRELIGKKAENIEFHQNNEATVEEVLRRLSEIHGSRFVEYVFDSKTGETKSFLMLLVNGRNIAGLDGLKTKLTDNDVLAILPPVGGG